MEEDTLILSYILGVKSQDVHYIISNIQIGGRESERDERIKYGKILIIVESRCWVFFIIKSWLEIYI